MLETAKAIQENPGMSNEKISELFNGEKTPRFVKRIRYTLNKATPEFLAYLQSGVDESPAEIDRNHNFQRGTTKKICEIYGFTLRKNLTRSWTQREIEMMNKYYPSLGKQALADMLGISITRVRVMAQDLGLRRDYQYSPEEEEYIMSSYTSGVRTQFIADELGRTTGAIRNFLHRRGIDSPENTNSPYYVPANEIYIINYLNEKLGLQIPDKQDKNNRSYFWRLVDRYEIDVPFYIGDYKFAIEYDGNHWHSDRLDKDEAKDQALKEAGYIVYRINSNDHGNDFYNLKSMDPILDNIIQEVMKTTGSRKTG